MPTYWSFAAVLVAVGLSSITLMTTANGTVQLGAAPEMRGRVMALYMAIFTGGTPIGAPIVGWVANTFGPRYGIGVGAAAGFAAAAVALIWLVRSQHLRLRHDAGLHFRVRHDGDGMPATASIAVQREAFAAELESHETLARR
jgi:MFS family permease